MKDGQMLKGYSGLSDAGAIRGKHILLVDDVITTGSTIESCVNELLKVEEVKVSVIAIGLCCDLKRSFQPHSFWIFIHEILPAVIGFFTDRIICLVKMTQGSCKPIGGIQSYILHDQISVCSSALLQPVPLMLLPGRLLTF